MALIFSALWAKLWPFFAGGITLFLAFIFGGIRQRRKQKQQEDQDYARTRKSLDEVRPDTDVDAARERLRARGESGGPV